MKNLLVTIIRQTFLKVAGKFQMNQERPKAFLVSFGLSVDHDKEDGYDYEKGSSPWQLIGDHDSGYTSAIEDLLRKYERRILVFDSRDEWYQVLTAPEGADPDSTWWQT